MFGLGPIATATVLIAIAIASGLTFSTLVSLLLLPAMYRLLGRRDAKPPPLEDYAPTGVVP